MHPLPFNFVCIVAKRPLDIHYCLLPPLVVILPVASTVGASHSPSPSSLPSPLPSSSPLYPVLFYYFFIVSCPSSVILCLSSILHHLSSVISCPLSAICSLPICYFSSLRWLPLLAWKVDCCLNGCQINAHWQVLPLYCLRLHLHFCLSHSAIIHQPVVKVEREREEGGRWA